MASHRRCVCGDTGQVRYYARSPGRRLRDWRLVSRRKLKLIWAHLIAGPEGR